MLRNYFKITLRNLKRNLTFSIINLLGLTFGLAITSLIVLYVSNDLSYDKYHKDSDRIYRLYREAKVQGFTLSNPRVGAYMGPYLKNTYHFIEEQTRVSKEEDMIISYEGNSYTEQLRYVDSSFFNMFTVRFVYGNKSAALINPFDIVITKKLANKIFGDINPVGLSLKSDKRTYTIKAVIEDVPENSYLKFDLLSSFSTKGIIDPNSKEGWGARYNSYQTFVKLTNGTDPQTLINEFPNIIKTYLSDQAGLEYSFDIQPLEDIYLYYKGGGDLGQIILFAVIGIFVLIIACINYMNLNTAESIRRMKEIGMRKVLGAHRKNLIWQLLLESIIVSLVSMVLALTLAEIFLPAFNTILQKNLRFEYIENWPLTASFFGLVLLTGFLAGTYPAFYLSAIKPIDSLKGKFVYTSIHGKIRNILVVFQFAITIFLLSCTGVVYLQIKYATTADLGFNPENVMVIRISPQNGDSQQDMGKMFAFAKLLKIEIDKIPEISDVSISSGFPYGSTMGGIYYLKDLDLEKELMFYNVDGSFIDLLGMRILQGRSFSDENSIEENNVIINQSMSEMLGYKNPIGKTFSDKRRTTKYTIIGVVKDFHRISMHRGIYPTFLNYSNNFNNYCAVGFKINSDNLEEVKLKVDEIIKRSDPIFDTEPWFISQAVEGGYEKEINTAHMFTNFSIVAIVIACMGLYGLALFMSRQKTKEIGIRKIFGSSIREIIVQLSKKFVLLVLIAAVVAIPVAWYYTDLWLTSFVYKVEGRWIVFVLATIVAIVIAFVTIYYQSLRAASGNPVDAIRYE